MLARKTSPSPHHVLGIFVALIATIRAVLGVTLLNIRQQNGFLDSPPYGFGTAVGLSLVLVLFAGIRERRSKRC